MFHRDWLVIVCVGQLDKTWMKWLNVPRYKSRFGRLSHSTIRTSARHQPWSLDQTKSASLFHHSCTTLHTWICSTRSNPLPAAKPGATKCGAQLPRYALNLNQSNAKHLPHSNRSHPNQHPPNHHPSTNTVASQCQSIPASTQHLLASNPMAHRYSQVNQRH